MSHMLWLGPATITGHTLIDTCGESIQQDQTIQLNSNKISIDLWFSALS